MVARMYNDLNIVLEHSITRSLNKYRIDKVTWDQWNIDSREVLDDHEGHMRLKPR